MVPFVRSTIALAAAALLAAASAARQQPVFRSGVDVVSVDVSVRAGNSPLQGLRAEDFDLRDNDVAQTINDISYETQPIDATIALDVSQSVNGTVLDGMRKAVEALMGDLGPGDRLKLFSFNERIVRAVDYTSDAKAASAAIKSAAGFGGTSILDAMAVALVGAHELDRRQLLVVFSDGRDSTSISERDGLLDVARRSHAAADVVLSARSMTGDLRDFYEAVAKETGGLVMPVVPGSDVSKAFRTVLSDFRSSYVLHFTPQGVERSGYHTLTVAVRRSGHLDVRARRGYFGG